jgi:N-formylglutamate amidohydrolase
LPAAVGLGTLRLEPEMMLRLLRLGALLIGLIAASACKDAEPASGITPSPGPSIDPGSFLLVETGSLPIVLSAPHGGTLAIPGVLERIAGSTLIDTNTYELVTAVQAQLLARTGRKAYLVAGRASRKYVDFNRAAADAYESAVMAPVYQAYHAALQEAINAAKSLAGSRALLVDLHGQSDNVDVVFIGTRNGQTAALSPLHTSPDGLLARLLAIGVRLDPSTADGIENPSYNGGHIVATYGASTGGIQAVQLEFGLTYRQPSAAWAETAARLADALAPASNCAACP